MLSWVPSVTSLWLETWGLRSLGLCTPRQWTLRQAVIKVSVRKTSQSWLNQGLRTGENSRGVRRQWWRPYLGNLSGGQGGGVKAYKPVFPSLYIAVLLKCLSVFPWWACWWCLLQSCMQLAMSAAKGFAQCCDYLMFLVIWELGLCLTQDRNYLTLYFTSVLDLLFFKGDLPQL